MQYDFDLTQLNGTQIGTLDECKENYLPLSVTGAFPTKRLATGDRFNDSQSDYRLLTDTLEADIRDMEGGAVAQVCMHANVKCRSVKIIPTLREAEARQNSLNATFRCALKRLNVRLKKYWDKIMERIPSFRKPTIPSKSVCTNAESRTG